MGRVGCFDNAVAEATFSTIKVEYVHRRQFRGRTEARLKIATWITDFYNRRRRHSVCNWRSPINDERPTTGAPEAPDLDAEPHENTIALAPWGHPRCRRPDHRRVRGEQATNPLVPRETFTESDSWHLGSGAAGGCRPLGVWGSGVGAYCRCRDAWVDGNITWSIGDWTSKRGDHGQVGRELDHRTQDEVPHHRVLAGSRRGGWAACRQAHQRRGQ
ncbi:integrase core domain-containing protein [Micromonospora sp. NBC_00858]|uniref:integrase core domain-containing protein n=1 Tax=Micromonospora sp. NBC_00858 TaxID=2975979 RepID=UPI00386FD0D3